MYSNRKLSLIALIVFLCAGTVFAIEEREGFSKAFDVSPGTYPILTVPSGKTFVLLQINSDMAQFSIKADSNIVIIGEAIIASYATGGADKLSHDFPDRCVVFEQGQVLELDNPTYTISIQIVGYFYNCNCPSTPVADLNKDCKVNFADLAIMASKWLTDNTILS